MNKKRHTVRGFVFVFALVGGQLLASPATAQSCFPINANETNPISGTVQNSCVPEDVPFNGFEQLKESQRCLSNGNVEFKADNRINAKGVGATTMANYTYTDQLKVFIVFDPSLGPLSIRTKTKLVADGPVADFVADSKFTVSGNGQPSTFTMETACRRSGN